ncbi:MAG: hypothetical protein ILM98_03075 [Kiritimatiellae bacterium]|nr:hypothetical protein [Kiritimatiellia bacterium]
MNKPHAFILAATAAAAVAVAPVQARTVTAGAPDANGVVALDFSGVGSQAQTLIAAWAAGDRGADPLAWAEYADAGIIAADATSATFTIPAAWREKSGAVRFFLMSGTPPYRTRYDFITRPDCEDGGLYIDTGIKPDSSLDISVKLKSEDMSSSAKMSPFGISGVVFIMPKSGTEYYYDFFGAKETTSGGVMGDTCLNVFGDAPPHDAEPHTFRLNREGLFIDGYRHLAFDQSKVTGSASSSTLTLFGRRNVWKQNGTTCSIYGATLSTNGVVACDLVPAAAPSGKIQMWDRVTHGWKGPAPNGTAYSFIPGNDIGPYPPDCGVVESVSAAIPFGPSLSFSIGDRASRTAAVTLAPGHDDGILFAVANAADAGTAFSAWTDSIVVGKVGAGTNAVTATLPNEWWRGRYQVRFAWKSIAGQPYDYAVESLDSDGTGKANVLTGWTPTTNSAISVNAKAASDVCAFGIASYFFLFQNGNTIYWNFFGNSGNTTCDGATFPAQYHEWSIGPDGASIDGDSLATFSGATETSLSVNVTLPFRSNANNQTIGKTGDVSVKSAKIWEGGILVRDFAPCVKNGVPGFFDNVRRGFYPSRTQAPFATGAPVVADGDFTAWSSAQELSAATVIMMR